MSHNAQLELWRNGVKILDFPGSGLSLKADAQSSGKFLLDPSDAAAINLNDGAVYDVYFVQRGIADVPAPTLVMRDCIARVGDYERAYKAPSGSDPGFDKRVRQVTIKEKLWDFQNKAPGVLVTHLQTDSDAELQFVASAVGASGAITTCPPVPMARMDYTRDNGYWEPLAGLFTPWDAMLLTDPSSNQIRLLDMTALHGSMLRQAVPLATGKYNYFPASDSLQDKVTQVRLVWADFGGVDGNPTIVNRRRVESSPYTSEDGSVTQDWQEVADIADDPDQPTVITRTDIPMSEGSSRQLDGEAQYESETTYLYEADYVRLKRKTTTQKGNVDLPGIGPQYLLFRTVTEELTYDDDPNVPGRKLLSLTTTTTRGYYVWTDTGNFDDLLRTGTPIEVASWNRTIDFNSNTSQRYDSGLISILTERRRRTSGGKMCTIFTVEEDCLRQRVKRMPPRTEIGDIAVDPVGRFRTEYIGVGGSKAAQIDATKIGHELGHELALRTIARSGAPVKTVRLRLMFLDYSQYRFGSVITLDTDAPYGLAGKYLCIGVDFTTVEPGANNYGLQQELELKRFW